MSRSIVIIGCGIIGSTTAYYLTRHPKFGPNITVHVLEATAVAAGASGKAGGFLAKDLHDGPTAALAALSFNLHDELSKEYGGDKKWGYRRVKTVEVTVSGQRRGTAVPEVDWIDGATSSHLMGTESTTAQVTPAEFTRSMMDFAQEKGVKLTIASAESLELEADDVTPKCVRAVDEKGETIEIPATDIVLAAGPWTARLASKLLGKYAGAALDIEPSGCSTSVIFRPSIPITSHALFIELTLPSGESVFPELYPRPDGTIYMCGDHTDPLRARSLPTRAADVTPSPHAVKNQTERLKWLCGRGFDDVKVEVEQACFRPESRRGKPVIGELAKGIYIASGHSVWGICNGPGTGKCMAELILDGTVTAANIHSLAP